MWASGGPQQRAATTTMTPLMLKFGIELGACQGLDLLMEEQVAGLCANEFNLKLIDIDATAKKLAGKFPYGFGAAYVATLVYENTQQDFTPASQLTTAPVTAARFGECSYRSEGKKSAAEISKQGAGRSRIRDVMNTAAVT